MARDLSPPQHEAFARAMTILREHFRCAFVIAKHEDTAGDAKVYTGYCGGESEMYGMVAEWYDNFDWDGSKE